MKKIIHTQHFLLTHDASLAIWSHSLITFRHDSGLSGKLCGNDVQSHKKGTREMSTTVVQGSMTLKMKVIGYWVTTAIVALELLAGGVTDLIHGREVLFIGDPVVEVLAHLGYPAYLLTILGVWKLLGAIALFAPRFPRLKEWAYAGTFFEATGAAASWVVHGDNASALGLFIFAALVLTSWILRPQSRTLGVIFPEKLRRRAST